MLRKFGIIAVLSLLVTAFAAVPALATQTTTIDLANAPQGTHFVDRGLTPECTVTTTTVTCPSAAFELAGVGNTNANANLSVTYTAIVDCFNPGVNPQNPIESHTQTATPPPTTATFAPTKNGRLTVQTVSSTAPTEAQFQALATCPNPNWTAVVRPGSITVSSFTYTLTFVGFTEPAITITGNDP